MKTRLFLCSRLILPFRINRPTLSSYSVIPRIAKLLDPSNPNRHIPLSPHDKVFLDFLLSYRSPLPQQPFHATSIVQLLTHSSLGSAPNQERVVFLGKKFLEFEQCMKPNASYDMDSVSQTLKHLIAAAIRKQRDCHDAHVLQDTVHGIVGWMLLYRGQLITRAFIQEHVLK